MCEIEIMSTCHFIFKTNKKCISVVPAPNITTKITSAERWREMESKIQFNSILFYSTGLNIFFSFKCVKGNEFTFIYYYSVFVLLLFPNTCLLCSTVFDTMSLEFTCALKLYYTKTLNEQKQGKISQLREYIDWSVWSNFFFWKKYHHSKR